MADFLHVQPKSSWKKVKFDRDFFSNGENIGPAFVEVLENYDISSVSKKSKKKKEKLASRKKKLRKKEDKKTKTEEEKESKAAEDVSKGKKESLQLKGKKRKLTEEKDKNVPAKKKQKSADTLKESSEPVESESKSSPKSQSNASKKKVLVEAPTVDESATSHDAEDTVTQNVAQSSSTHSDMEKFKSIKPNGMKAWNDLYVPNEVLWALKDQGFTYPTPIQIRTLPPAIRDKMDILGAAETGSGKTLAFGIPLIHYILRDKQKTDKADKETDDTVGSSDEDQGDLDTTEQTEDQDDSGEIKDNHFMKTNDGVDDNDKKGAGDSDSDRDFDNKDNDCSKDNNFMKTDDSVTVDGCKKETGDSDNKSNRDDNDDNGSDRDNNDDDDDGGSDEDDEIQAVIERETSIDQADDNGSDRDNNDDDDDDDDDDGGSEEDDEIQAVIDRETSKDQADDLEGSGDASSDEEVEDLQEGEIGCVRVVEDVDFSWFENEGQQSKKPVLTHPFALILEPTRELAIQVKQHLTAITKYTDIKIATIVGGMSVQKQRRVLKRCPDIIVATPGRLWDLQQEGEAYLSEIEKTRYLVIDEADRMVEKGHFEELSSLLLRMNRDSQISSKRHTYVFSATLTTVHEGPQRYNQKKNKIKKFAKLTETQKLEMLMETIGLKAKPKVIDLSRKVGTVETLTEARIHCSNEEKDVHLYYFLKQYPGRTLVFCNSKDCIRRLVSVLDYLKCTPLPLHADMHQRQRLKNLDRFKGNPKGLLIASDVAARGLDIPNVQHVIHFQVPNIVENYIHRSGRTARALKEGLSVVLIGPNDMKNYKKIINTLNRDEDLPLFPVDAAYLSEVQRRVDLVREIETQEYRFQKGKRQNDWLKKMADESGIEIDDEGLLADIGDERRQAEYRRTMKHLKSQLDRLLKEPIITETSGGKFPTKMGKLDVPLDKGESDGAIAHLKTVKRKQDKYLKRLRKKVPSEKPMKKKKDKWAKKKRKRMMAKAVKQSDS